jgi:hypothetical protein
MPQGAWAPLASADLANVTPTISPGGSLSGRIDAWNGFAADTLTSRMYLGGAGGHADYAGNEVYSIDMMQAAPAWLIETQPSPASAYTVDTPYYADGRPSPTHTYYTLWFIEGRSKLFRFAGAATWGTGNGGTDRIDSWDPTAKAWDPDGTNPHMGKSPTYEAPTAKNLLTGDVYQLQADNHLYRWTQATNTVTDLGMAEGGTDSFYDLNKSPAVVDTAGGRLLFLSDSAAAANHVRAYDLVTKKWSTAAALGPAASMVTARESQAMAFFDYCMNRIVVKTTSGGAVFAIDPATLTATTLSTSGTAPGDAINGVHTLFQSLPKLGGYAYQPSHGETLYFLATQ